jgi:hypothetical protein
MVELFMNEFGKDVAARNRGLPVPMWCVSERCMENDQKCEYSRPADLPNTKQENVPLIVHAKELI